MKFATALPWAGPAGTPGNVRAFAAAAEELGFDHVKMGEHLARHPLPPASAWAAIEGAA